MIKKQKLESYEAPITNVLELRFEGMVCTSPGLWDDSIIPGTNWGGDSNDYGLE